MKGSGDTGKLSVRKAGLQDQMHSPKSNQMVREEANRSLIRRVERKAAQSSIMNAKGRLRLKLSKKQCSLKQVKGSRRIWSERESHWAVRKRFCVVSGRVAEGVQVPSPVIGLGCVRKQGGRFVERKAAQIWYLTRSGS